MQLRSKEKCSLETRSTIQGTVYFAICLNLLCNLQFSHIFICPQSHNQFTAMPAEVVVVPVCTWTLMFLIISA